MLGGIGLAGGATVGNWILAPLEARCKMVANPTQFPMVALLRLFVVLQFPLAGVGMTVRVFGQMASYAITATISTMSSTTAVPAARRRRPR